MKNIYIYFIVLSVCLTPIALSAQQFAFYSMYQRNWQIINPAAPNIAFVQDKGAENIFNVSYRQQWIGVKDAPANYNVHFESMMIEKGKKLNAKYGFGLYGEPAGAIQNNTLYFNYAYPITLDFGHWSGRNRKLFFGFNAGYLHQRIAFKSVRFDQNIPDETVDNIIREQKVSGGQSFFELTPGLFYTNTESFYVGLSSPRLVTVGRVNNAVEIVNPKPQIHLIAGHFNEEMTFQPSVWLRWQSTIDNQSIIAKNPISATFNVKSQISKSLLLGLGVSSGKWIHLETGWQIGGTKKSMNATAKTILLNFAYDVPIGKTGLNLGQTAEVNLTFFL
jgi:type IX secretion system PorP/SprF family membrane protein